MFIVHATINRLSSKQGGVGCGSKVRSLVEVDISDTFAGK
jgi:hypothetical protein